MRKAIVLFRILVLALALIFVGCGDDDGDDTDNTGGSGGGLSGVIGNSSGGGTSNNNTGNSNTGGNNNTGGGQTTDPQTCAEIVDCVADGGGDPYGRNPCYRGAPANEGFHAIALFKCIEVSGCEDQDCIVSECYDFVGVCAANPALSGNSSCPQVFDCIGDSSDGAEVRQCVEQSTPTAKDSFSLLLYCMSYECEFDNDCISQTCEADLNSCRNS